MHIFWLERRVLWISVDLLLSLLALELAGLTLVLWLIWFHLVEYWRKSRSLTQFWWYFELKSSTHQSAATVYILGCSDSCSMNSALISQIHFIAVGTGWGVPMTFTWNTNIYVSFFLFLQCSYWTAPRCWVCSYSGKCSSTFQPRTMGRWGPGKGTLKTAVSCAPCHSPLENSAKSMLHFLVGTIYAL